jgi:propionate CoA-transferase
VARVGRDVNLLDRAGLIAHLLRWRLTWDRRDTGYRPPGPLSDKFRSARDAMELLTDGATVISCGIASNARCSVFFWALRERFERTGRPGGLTWISVAAQGGRGRVPGTVEELGLDGLLSRYIVGHVETARAMLALAEAGRLELHTLPQGEMTAVLDAQTKGERTVRSRTGVGTFLDPRTGRGSAVTEASTLQLIEADGDALVYTLPPVDVALFSAPYADRAGNLYFDGAATLTENVEAARAARRNGGIAMACVADLVEEGAHPPDLAADEIDVVVVNPRNEQTGSVLQRRHWPMFTAAADVDEHEAALRLRFINELLGITPHRSAVEYALGRLGAWQFTEYVPAGATVNIGVGLPEEVCRTLYDSRVHEHITFTTEAGAYGGLPAPGIFFGAAVHPQKLESSAWMFRHYREHLDAAMLGFLQLDGVGNVNLSRRGPRITDYVGPGGAPSIIESARTVLFIGRWMTGASVAIEGERVQVRKAGKPKLVDRVDEVTFNGRVALADGKRVVYVTDLGVLELTEQGLVLRAVMPGIDVERDLRANSTASLHVPEDVRIVPTSVVTGRDFHLRWAPRKTLG